MNHRTLALRGLSIALLTGLGAAGCDPIVCGDGTTDIDGRCRPTDLACGVGAVFEPSTNQCLGTDDGLQCGPGTRLEAGACVPTAATGPMCADGTVLAMDGASCVVAPTACGDGTDFDLASRTCIGVGNITCGPGTAEADGLCLPSAQACGPGTVWSPEVSLCVRGEAYVGDCANPTIIDGGARNVLEGDVVLAAGGCFEVPVELRVEGTLRIEPGVTVVFHQGARLFVVGALSAVGTQMAPILLRGEAAQPGYWDGVVLEDSDRLDNRLEFVEIAHGGGEGYRGLQGGLMLRGRTTRASLSNLALRDNASFGLDTEDVTLESFVDVTVTGSELAAIRMPANAIGQLSSAATLTGNGREEVEIRGGRSVGGRILRDASWPKLDVPYHVTGNIDVEARLELGPDLLIRVAENVEWFVRPQGILRSIAPNATTIEGDVARPGHWSGLIFDGSEQIDNALVKLEVAHGGGIEYRGRRANIALSDWSGPVRLAMRDVISRRSEGYGFAASAGATLDFETVTLTQNTLGAAAVAPEVALQLDGQSSSYTGNEVERIVVDDRSGSIRLRVGGRLPAANVPYQFGDLFLSAPLSIEAGAELRFREGAELFVQGSGSLNAVGTTANPIIFAGEVQVPGYWDGVRFESSDRIDNRLEHAVIAHGGRAAYRGLQANLVIRGTPDPVRLSLSDVLFEMGAAAGVAISPNLVMPTCARVTFLGVVPEVIDRGVSRANLCSN